MKKSKSDKSSTFSEKNENDESVRVRFWQLLKYASPIEITCFVIGTLASILVGLSSPIAITFFSDIVYDFSSQTFSFQPIIEAMAMLGGATFVVAYIQMFCLQFCARRQAKRIRRLYFSSILRQEVTWFDQNNVGTAITRLTEGVDKIEAGLGEKSGIFVQNIVVFISGLVIGYTKSWELSLVGTAVFPPIVIAFAAVGFVIRKYSVKERKAYSRANSIAGEILSSIRTIFAFEGQERELNRYIVELSPAEKVGIKKSTLFNLVWGSADASIYVMIAVTFYYGIVMLTEGRSDPGAIILVVFAMLFGGITIGQAFQQLDHFNLATSAAGEIFPLIDRIPPIDKNAPGDKLTNFKGEISFSNVSFTYPTRQDVQVLKNFSWTIKPGQTVAIVGPSGSGKSTVVQMIQRFYDPDIGDVFIDGKNLRSLDLPWLRSKIGVVSQEPVLFTGTIAENIRLGRQDATQEEIEAASKIARAHDFIVRLPEAYNTFVAEGGGGMSGGQKQRIAIARALLRDPKILLLDEATSALDTKSEKLVQVALDAARTGRTTVIVAHRLSTIRDADVIVVVDRGVVVEAGNHQELLAKNGVYAKLASRGLKEELKGNSGDNGEEKESDDDNDIANILKESPMENVKKPTTRNEVDFDVKSTVSSLMGSMIDFGEEKKPNIGLEILRMNKPEMGYLILGCLMAMLSGGVQASFVIVYTEIYDIFATGDNANKLARAQKLAGAFGGLAFARLLFVTMNGYALGVAGERLTKRCRTMLFKTMLGQEVGWFDEVDNQPGTLTGQLAADVPTLQNVSGRRLGSMVEVFVLVFSSLFIGFFYSWEITLVALAYFPILIVAGAFEMQSWTGTVSRVSVKGAGLAHEVFSAARTVFSIQAEDHFVERYENCALLTEKVILKGVARYALVSAIANSLMSFEFAGVFYAGGKLMEMGRVSFLEVFRSYTAVSFAASNLGYAASFAPDSKKAGRAAEAIFKVLRREPQLIPDDGLFPDTRNGEEVFQGNVSFRNVRFRYPTRKQIQVLKGFSYDVPEGKSVALVGQSGCGKSTLIQLVQRFYDPSSSNLHGGGEILIDGKEMRSLAPNWIRRHIGVVSQEPNLLDMSIGDNIAYGLNHLSSEQIPMERIIDAAKQANAHTFIADLPQGYDTPVGARGSQLSGGQKQRVAIARALIRNPRLLLLDEATAALDNESEQLVQAALDNAMKRGERTTLVVAHRLTTVQNCDLIVVLEEGRAVESGSPAALMKAKGAYYSLHNTA